MEWFAFMLAIVAVAMAASCETKTARLTKRMASLEELCMKSKPRDGAG